MSAHEETIRAEADHAGPDPEHYLLRAAAQGIERAEVLVTRVTRDEVTAVAGRIDSALSADSTTVNLGLRSDGRSCYVTAGASVDPATAVGRGAALLSAVRPRPTASPEESSAPRRPAADARLRRPRARTEDLLRRGTADDGPEETETRVWAETRAVRFARDDSATDAYTHGLFGGMVRCVSRAGGTVGHSTQLEYCGDEEEFHDTLLPNLLTRARAHARALSAPQRPAGTLPPATVLDAPVAAHVVALTVDSLLADAVLQARSRYREALGTPVAAVGLDLVDDSLADGPIRAPFDDEGVPTRRRVLIGGGVLHGFLADRTHAGLDGAAAGSAWKPWSTAAPRPAPSNLRLSAPEPEPVVGRRLRVIETYGGHTANPVTGEFSFGAAALIEEEDGTVHPLTGLSVAGNAFDVLRRSRAVRGPARWFGCRGGYLGCPDLVVEGLVIGR